MKTYALFNNSFFTNKPWWMPQKLYQVVCQRANPRTKEYMLDLLTEKFPEVSVVNIDQLPSDAQHFILLYPDSIGLGWGSIDKELCQKVENISILNGRKRYFPLASGMRRNLHLKRFLEITFLPELLFVPLFLILGTAFALKDMLKGRS